MACVSVCLRMCVCVCVWLWWCVRMCVYVSRAPLLVCSQGAAEASERVENAKMPQLLVDEDAKAILQKPFDKWAVKGKLHKAHFVEYISKTHPLLDRHY